jgi:uncharacterized membrane protein YgdD (TMEM256/DUF423 family)
MEEKNQYLRNRIALACVLMSVSVMLGAFGAHALKDKLNPDQLSTYETSNRYLVYNTMALLVLCFLHLNKLLLKKSFITVYRFFLLGIGLFSGSLYLLTIFNVAGVTGMNWLGAITPFGGITFIITWLYTAFKVSKSSHSTYE